MYNIFTSILSLLNFVSMNVHANPNFVVIFADDMGYGDLQSYGHPSQEKGPIDAMAEEGIRFTHWYSAESLCTPSRAALLTGRLPVRIGMVGPNRVLWQLDAGGLPKTETTIAEELTQLGYATGMVGKWHLGINEHSFNDGNHLPVHHGFQYVGTNFPYGQNWKCDKEKFSVKEMAEKCFKYKNVTMVQQPTHLEKSTEEMVNDAKNFIRKHSRQPFFFYMPLLQTHSALFCSNKFCGKSKRGLYGDNINEMSWAVGEVLNTLKELEIDKNTLVLFISDHGPQLELCTEGGSAGLFKGGKGSVWEGGLRVPAIAWWPGTIPAGVVNHEIVSSLDVYSTILELAGKNNADSDGIVRDGKSLADLLRNGEPSPHDFLFLYCSDRLMAVRYKSFKFYFYTQNQSINSEELCVLGKPKDDVLTYLDCYGKDVTAHNPPLIFNVDEDPGENFPLSSLNFKEMLEKLHAAVRKHKSSVHKVKSVLGLKNESLQPCCNPPVCQCNYDTPQNLTMKTEL
ncbi:arylsulfatase-like [Styela clava]